MISYATHKQARHFLNNGGYPMNTDLTPGTRVRYIGPPLPYRTGPSNWGTVADVETKDSRYVWVDLGESGPHPVRRTLVRLEGEW